MAERNRFFIIGAQRSGTSYLYELLAQHPEIEMATPLKPEPKFFLVDDLYGRGINFYERNYFAGKPGARVYGEKSTSYLESSVAAQRIARHYPDALILVMLRDPIERALSHYRFSCDNGVETLPFEQAMLEEAQRTENFDRTRFSVSPFAYMQRSRYIDYLAVYERIFPSRQLFVMQTEQLVSSIDARQSLLSFLGVDTKLYAPSSDRSINASRQRDIEISSETRRSMVEYFKDSSLALGKKYGFDLSLWPSVEAASHNLNNS